MGVFINFTDAQGKHVFRIEFVDLESNTCIAHGETPELEFKDKLASNYLIFNLQGVKFNHPGTYELRLYANKALCEIKTFHAKQG